MIIHIFLVLFAYLYGCSAVHWAVQVDGGIKVAEQIALENGFNFVGKVGELNGIYHFSTTGGYTRSLKRRIHILQRSNKVGLLLRQRVKFHEKKEYTVPVDPLWNLQWQLHGNGETNNNVQRAWLQGVSGEGVTVGVVDDGLEHSHPDLAANYASELSVDLVNRDGDPRPRSSSNTHGTQCAGIIGMAKDNNKCGVGVAYNSKIAGLKLLTDHGTTDIQEATALNYKYNEIDIYSNSWGPTDSGFSVGGPDFLTKMALENGVKHGRQGKGSIFVWAAGNGGLRGDSCAADGYVNSVYTIAVGSADESGNAAYFDEPCSAKLVVTFNHDSTNGVHMSTTTGVNSCMSSFTGTSAASPFVSGIIALALQANPSLTWRDVQYLLIYTANSDALMSPSTVDLWATNGAGLKVSPQFGFGAVNAEAMVTRAQYWTTVPDQIVTNIVPTSKSGKSSNTNSYSVSWEMNSPSRVGDVTPFFTNITFLEHVVVKMTLRLTFDDIPSYSYDEYYGDKQEDVLSHKLARRGDISIYLRSPQGTLSELLPTRKRDFINTNGYRNWEFLSVHYWGENPLGVWELLVLYKSQVGVVRVSNISVKLHGMKTVPHSVEYISSQCTDKCNNRCSLSYGVEICDTCMNKRNSETMNCLAECPLGYKDISGYCMNPNSSSIKENSKLYELPTRSSTEDIVFPTPSRSFSDLPRFLSSSQPSIANTNSMSSTFNTNPVTDFIIEKEFKASSGIKTTSPQLLQWFILVPLILLYLGR